MRTKFLQRHLILRLMQSLGEDRPSFEVQGSGRVPGTANLQGEAVCLRTRSQGPDAVTTRAVGAYPTIAYATKTKTFFAFVCLRQTSEKKGGSDNSRPLSRSTRRPSLPSCKPLCPRALLLSPLTTLAARSPCLTMVLPRSSRPSCSSTSAHILTFLHLFCSR